MHVPGKTAVMRWEGVSPVTHAAIAVARFEPKYFHTSDRSDRS